jgi:hypothetical protein
MTQQSTYIAHTRLALTNVKVVLDYAMKAYGGRKCTAPLILHLGPR